MPKIAKVPVIMQMEALECGAASLCMILAFYGKWLPLEQVRADCGVSRDGSSAKNILKAARAYGLKAAGYRMEPSALRNIVLPAIIHWNFNHFVVLNGFTKDKVILNDPARGTVKVSFEEFDQSFTGIVLRFEKTESFVAEGKPKSVLGFAKKRLRGTATAFAFVILTGILTAGIGMITPLFTKVFMDHILSGKNPEWLSLFIIAMTLTLVFQFVIAGIQGIYWLKIEGKLAIEANASFMWHVLRLPVDFFSQRFAGDIASRQASNEHIASTLIGQLAPIFMNVCLLVFYLSVMLRYSVILSLVGIGAALVNMLVLRFISQKRVDMSRVMQRDVGKLSGITMSGFEMMESIKASGAENGFFERWAGYFAKQSNAQIVFAKANQFYGMIPSLLQQAANICVLMIGVYLILDGEFTIGMLLAFQGFLSSFLTPVNQLVEVGQAFIEMRSQMERVEDVMNYPTDVSDSDNGELPNENGEFVKLSGEMQLENVTFGYNKLSPPLLENFSLNLKPGGSVAFVGGSGSGKSTLAKLISGLYSPWSGEIRFDGLTRDKINRGILTSSLAVVDQDVVLFEDTIMNNITMWDESIDEAVLVTSCKDAQIHEDIMQRQGGYAHVIKEGGKNFSGGQKQRFEIARALAQEPSILILDEATSALDTKTEQHIMETVKARGISLIIIAHRLSTIRDCDEIIVLDKGKVAERGRHEELMLMGGKYATLISN
ncbi:NHLM bacteriocin system ABC transporter, peptidase/ATP-binding protein [Desulfosporosinus orientis DSM 765]|uniref:NHLM bacteriocin system ABC transporter, peptidase/ATP-binding protein n=1 Tax=Desulfosporosinus orientis (strain ATCC 19365 / DSM 765 / NCIMB 8382 / VKM B-1628 / Singapore I) TaxID=768706 RepID=G7W6V8_DESOD|nr:NHLP family bacteriocin export ABC transporter peptidase/permease/ATPase subunit [Desulfosporosinus orientis]AET69240.1 NHLM bacteriocin system ABC transporter, peptidase/ATP-binding protein [Desulfosporosinus orientis DSM 765]